MKKMFITYDARALDNTDDAAIFETNDNLQEAVKFAPDYGEGCCIYSYDIKGKELINEKFEKQVWSKSNTRT